MADSLNLVALSVKEAQDAIAATIPELEKISWTCFTISRELGPPEGEDFPVDQPLPEQLRWSTSLSAMALYYELQETISLARKAAELSELDLGEDIELETPLSKKPRGGKPREPG
jgi:hypothetical protein